MDKLDTIIRQKRRQLATLKKSMDDAVTLFKAAQLELSALERAADLRPAMSARETRASIADKPLHVAAFVERKRGGRKEGALSKKWRSLVSQWVQDGNVSLTEAMIYRMAKSAMGLAQSSVKQRIRRFVEQGFLETDDEGAYRVSALAINRFSLRPLPDEVPGDDEVPEVRH
jgi:hypothetical protein